jgi:hypothetical protein
VSIHFLKEHGFNPSQMYVMTMKGHAFSFIYVVPTLPASISAKHSAIDLIIVGFNSLSYFNTIRGSSYPSPFCPMSYWMTDNLSGFTEIRRPQIPEPLNSQCKRAGGPVWTAPQQHMTRSGIVDSQSRHVDGITPFYLAALQYARKNPLLGHYAVTHLVVDSAAGVAFLPDLSHFQEHVGPDLEPVPFLD